LFGGPEEWGVALKSLAPGGSGGVAAPLFGTPGPLIEMCDLIAVYGADGGCSSGQNGILPEPRSEVPPLCGSG
jgi:hypothetical protein